MLLVASRRGFIDAIKVQNKAQVPDAKLERIVALMDSLSAIDPRRANKSCRLMIAVRCAKSARPHC